MLDTTPSDIGLDPNLHDVEVNAQRPDWRYGHMVSRARKDLVYDAYLNGMEFDEIVDGMGADPKVVRKHLKECGVDVLSKEDKFRLGLFGPLFRATINQAAEICNVEYQVMYEWCKRHGVETK